MAAMSDFLEQAIINHLLRGIDIGAPPANVYIALYTAAPSDSGGGTEVSGGSYVRKQVSTLNQWSDPGSTGLTDNINAITWPEATANWGTISHIGIFDALTGGNLLLHGALAASKVINTGNTFEIPAGDLDIVFA